MTPGTRWRKSSFSGTNGDCVEVAWHRSSFSGTNGNCVEVAHTDPIAVRDSKNPTGGQLRLQPTAWAGFLAAVGSTRS
ncbi:DUF397 domain-containing protein [Actinokineospora soli]|uniref:DUF397 domain-containing protein n=1 Tax=Actinokineospora soli TaxID=1048753 RepID=A0ABW2TU41_9PSEU